MISTLKSLDSKFTTEHLAISNLLRHKAVLQTCCTIDEFMRALDIYDKKKIENVCNTVLTSTFWTKEDELFRVIEPLMRVLRVVNQDEKPTVPVIYEVMERTKMSIKVVVKHYKKYWDIIDERWNKQLHNDSHAAGKVLIISVY